MVTLKRLKGIAVYLAGMLEAMLRTCVKYSLWLASACLYLMFIEQLRGEPINPLYTFISAMCMTIVVGQTLSFLLLIKWAWRKRKGSKERDAS